MNRGGMVRACDSRVRRFLKEVVIPEKILNVIAALREHCANEMSLYISDRRLVKAAQLLRVAAAAVGSREVQPATDHGIDSQ
eukprot:1150964-Amphidinium_carterae.1